MLSELIRFSSISVLLWRLLKKVNKTVVHTHTVIHIHSASTAAERQRTPQVNRIIVRGPPVPARFTYPARRSH